MNTVFKSDQIYILSEKLKISQKDCKKILDSYVNRLLDKINNGKAVKFLNICYLVPGSSGEYNDTLSYISYEIGKDTKLGKEVVFRVLSEFGNFIADDLKKFYSYTIRGLVNISLEEYKRGVYKVRIRSCKNLRDLGYRVVTINSFKRKVEMV